MAKEHMHKSQKLKNQATFGAYSACYTRTDVCVSLGLQRREVSIRFLGRQFCSARKRLRPCLISFFVDDMYNYILRLRPKALFTKHLLSRKPDCRMFALVSVNCTHLGHKNIAFEKIFV